MADIAPQPNITPTPSTSSGSATLKADVDLGIKELEEKYQKEVGVKEELSSRLGQLEKDQLDIETDIRNRGDKIKILLEKLRVIKGEIEVELKRLNELKEVDKEIKEDMEEIKRVEEKVKTLEEKMAVLKI